MLIGCAVFHDILKPTSLLCKHLQSDQLCTVSAIEAMLKSTKAIEKLKTLPMEDFPSVKKIMLRVKDNEEESDRKTYQGIDLTNFDSGLTFLKDHSPEFIESVLSCMRSRLKPHERSEDTVVLNHALKIIATHGWEKTEDASFGYESIEYLISRFSTPLQEAGIDIALIQEEWDDIVSYAKLYINVVQNSYKEVWWKLYNCADTPKWSNFLSLVELIFVIPLSNGHVERCFSQLKLTKSDRRSCLKQDRLDNLLRIRIEGPPLDKWKSDKAIQLWWGDKTRRVNRSETLPTSTASATAATGEEFSWSLDNWDNWLESESDADS